MQMTSGSHGFLSRVPGERFKADTDEFQIKLISEMFVGHSQLLQMVMNDSLSGTLQKSREQNEDMLTLFS